MRARFGLDDPVEKYLPEFAGLKVFESFDAATGEYRLRPASGLTYPFLSATWRAFKLRAGETYPFGGPVLFDPGELPPGSFHLGRIGQVVSSFEQQKRLYE
jgi:methyl acetate hydrolase